MTRTEATATGWYAFDNDRVEISVWPGRDADRVDITVKDYDLGGDNFTEATAAVSKDSLLNALQEVGLVPDDSDVVVRESDLPAVEWDAKRGEWALANALSLRPAWIDANGDLLEANALATLALVRHARTHEPPQTNAERLAEMLRTHGNARSWADLAAVLDASGVKAPE